MNNSPTRIGSLLSLALLLSACGQQLYPTEFTGQPQPPCTVAGTPFAKKDFAKYEKKSDPPEYQWDDLYKEQLKKILTAHEKMLFSSKEQELECAAPSYQQLLPASPPLKELAGQLPAYKNRASKLSEMDIVPVLLEWQRTYECAMHEESVYASPHVQKELSNNDGGVFDDSVPLSFPGIAQEVARRQAFIEWEVKSSRAILERLVTLLGGFDRLRPLSAELLCLGRASADIRNSLSLVAESSACLPRALDVKDSLRDFDLN